MKNLLLLFPLVHSFTRRPHQAQRVPHWGGCLALLWALCMGPLPEFDDEIVINNAAQEYKTVHVHRCYGARKQSTSLTERQNLTTVGDLRNSTRAWETDSSATWSRPDSSESVTKRRHNKQSYYNGSSREVTIMNKEVQELPGSNVLQILSKMCLSCKQAKHNTLHEDIRTFLNILVPNVTTLKVNNPEFLTLPGSYSHCGCLVSTRISVR